MSSSKRARNAFAELMGSSIKKAKSSGFVECPICGLSVPELRINDHLDAQCNQSGKAQQQQQQQQQKPESNRYQTSEEAKAGHGCNHTPQDTKASVSSSGENAFSRMMLQSARVFSSLDKEPSQDQRFHLCVDGSLTWNNEDVRKLAGINVQWSSEVQLRRQDDQKKIRLHVSSAIPSAELSAGQYRLVRTHSRLSVSVLKSILQKSIRRRRALPACRVAMELMDKNMAELLRRVPVIILEDSTLHPDFPLLCWLMAAESKGYRLPRELIERVLRIIYEVSSCQWTDYVPEEERHDESPSSDTTDFPSEGKLLLRSIRMRRSYGGMAGDMKMLQSYEALWKKRFESNAIDSAVLSRLSANQTLCWLHVPAHIHQKAKQTSLKFIIPMVQKGVERLELKDCCVEGIDFHCSDVLDQLLMDERLAKSLERRLREDGQIWDEKSPQGKAGSQLTKILKTCMWRFSSGVNHRQPLLGSKAQGGKNEHVLKAFWFDLVSKPARSIMTRYVQSRLRS